MSAASSSGVLATGTSPWLVSCSRTSAKNMIRRSSALSLATMSRGSFAGPITAYQPSMSSMKSMPPSRNVGASGAKRERPGPVTARNLSFPTFCPGSSACTVPNIICTRPPSKSVIAPDNPL